MQKKIFLGMLGLALVLTGCEVSKEEVMKKKYVLIAQNVESMACSFVTMDTITEKFGLKGTNYHEDSNRNADCAAYGKVKDETCGITQLTTGDNGFGSSACAIGADSLNGGQDKNATQTKHYVLLVQNVDPDLCGKIVIEPIATDEGYNDVTFYEDAHAECNDFSSDTQCKIKSLTNDDKGHGNSTCVVGTDTQPHS